MASAKKPNPTPQREKAATTTKPRTRDARDGLSVYIEHPEQNPEGLVVEYDDDYVVIKDKYPKASVHLLLLPRSPTVSSQHPLLALSTNPALLADVRARTARLKTLVASELRRKYSHESASDAPYRTALEALMSSPAPPSPTTRAALLPAGRDWAADVMVGVHTHPSMNHLHIHILSRESHSPCLKHKKHYLSFHSSFFVGLHEFPLDAEKDARRFRPGDWPSWDMRCWRCGRNFGNRFSRLKAHLEEEFGAWKKQ